MAVRAIREYDGKRLLSKLLLEHASPADALLLRPALGGFRALPVRADGPTALPDFAALAAAAPWVLTTKLVVKPDQLIKRRGKGGLLLLNADWPQAVAWMSERAGQAVVVDGVKGVLDTFLVEPFVPHAPADEYYVCIASARGGEEILFTPHGGVDVGDVDATALRLFVPITAAPPAMPTEGGPSSAAIESALLGGVPPARRPAVAAFVGALYRMHMAAHFTYLEINPLVVTGGDGAEDGGCVGGVAIAALDMAAKLDEAAAFLAGAAWSSAASAAQQPQPLAFPPPFGRRPEPEEAYIREMDGKTGASLKLTILNRRGRVWTMVAGGGASVVYADTVSDLGFGAELANYGEYSGAPSEEQTYEYAKTILRLLAAEALPAAPPPAIQGKVLIIGGGIANFTNVAATFAGIIRALREAAPALHEHRVSVWVRRGGPNYQEGLRQMAALGAEIGVPVHVHGPDTHITAIVPLALGVADAHGLALGAAAGAAGAASGSGLGGVDGAYPLLVARTGTPPAPAVGRPLGVASRVESATSLSAVGGGGSTTPAAKPSPSAGGAAGSGGASAVASAGTPPLPSHALFSPATRCIVYGMQTRAVQGMLDFDAACGRATPSVAAMVFPFSGAHFQQFYWGPSQVMLPVYPTVDEAMRRHPEVSVCVNFASFRSVYASTLEALAHAPRIRTVAIIAEGVPEQQARRLIVAAAAAGVALVGPATVGGVAAGAFRIGNTGGALDNIIACKLYRAGSVGYVSKSGGMSNELNNIMAAHTDGVCEGVAIGGDRYPGSLFIDHLLRYQANPHVKMLVLLGEVGGVDEYAVAEALRDGRITKPLVAWCIGTCAKMFPFEVQFGHAGALAGSFAQTADAKNAALRAAGAVVPDNFNDFVARVAGVYQALRAAGNIEELHEPPTPKVPMDYSWAKSMGLVRKPAAFVSSISDDRGEELLYAGVPISRVVEEGIGIGGTISLLWFRRRLPDWAAKFIELCVILVADHGAAVSGAHNTIVTARAGKDLVSSLCSGLLTIGPRFGGALDEAAQQFSRAHDAGVAPGQFVKDMRAANKLIMGIGHRVKSVSNPDKRVVILKEYAAKHFPATDVLGFALEVERHTTAKKENLILNVDGAIAACFVDLLRSCGCFTREEADEALANGCLNGLFVLGRTIGFCGHYLDAKRLKQGLYRHATDDIVYISGDADL